MMRAVPSRARGCILGRALDGTALIILNESLVFNDHSLSQCIWFCQEKGLPQIHIQANPTSGEVLRKKEMVDSEAKREAHRKALILGRALDGTALIILNESLVFNDHSLSQRIWFCVEYTKPNALRETMVVENERFIEYDESGAIKGAPKIVDHHIFGVLGFGCILGRALDGTALIILNESLVFSERRRWLTVKLSARRIAKLSWINTVV
jgi:hypothetical protein